MSQHNLLNAFCRRDIEDNSVICYNCACQIVVSLNHHITIMDNLHKKVLLCNDGLCKKEFDIDNKGKIININKVFRLIVEGGIETYYCSLRRLNDAKKKEMSNIVFESTEKYDEDDFGSLYENNLDSTCYDSRRRMICAYCKKPIDLDDDENRKELWGGQPDANSHIMPDGCTVLIFCDRDCVDKSYSF